MLLIETAWNGTYDYTYEMELMPHVKPIIPHTWRNTHHVAIQTHLMISDVPCMILVSRPGKAPRPRGGSCRRLAAARSGRPLARCQYGSRKTNKPRPPAGGACVAGTCGSRLQGRVRVSQDYRNNGHYLMGKIVSPFWEWYLGYAIFEKTFYHSFN